MAKSQASMATMRATAVVTIFLLQSFLQEIKADDPNSASTSPPEKKDPPLFSSEQGFEGKLIVSRDSPYCNWKTAMGPVCVYNQTDQVVVVPAGLRLSSGQLEVEVHEAKTLHVYPTCVSWIQVFSAGLVNTLPSQEAPDCRTWLRVYNSKVDTVAYGVKDLTLVDTQVNTINLVDQRDFMAINSTIKSVEALEWEGYRGTILNTSIQRVSHIVAKDSWYILESHLGFVTTEGMTFHAREMSVINTTILHVAPQGLTIDIGAVSFTNVTIDFLEMNAIVMTTPMGFLALNNVTIMSAFAPCIVLPDKEKISLTNVTIKGVPLNYTSPYLKFRDDEKLSSSLPMQIESLNDLCSSSSTTLSCDLNNVNETVVVHGDSIKPYRVLNIRNARDVRILSLNCGTELQLQWSSAFLPHILPITSGDSKPPCTIAVSAWHSKLEVVSVAHIDTMNISHSTVSRLHGGQLQNLVLVNSTVEELDGLLLSGDGASWQDVSIGSLFNITIVSPISASKVRLREKVSGGSVTVDHPNKTSVLQQLKASRLERRSFVVRNGSKLIVSDILGIMAAKDSIVLEEGATLNVIRGKFLLPSYGIVSATSLNQVTAEEISLSDIVNIRSPPLSIENINNLTVTNVQRSPFCHKLLLFHQICNFSSAPEGQVTVDLTEGQFSHRAIVTFAASVLIYPSCIEKLILMDVINATTVDNGRDCQTWLEATGVHFANITSGVLDVTLTSCSVDLLAPDRTLRDVDLEGSKVARISGVHWTGYTGVFNNSQLVEVGGMQADSRMIMTNSTVGTFLEGGLTIVAEGIISNSTIKQVMTDGITIKGLSHMQDVTFGTLAKGAIVVKDGLLLLSNVSIGTADEGSIVASKNGGVSFQNVTVSGKTVHWLGYLADPLSPLNHSLVLLNKHYNESKESISGETSAKPRKQATTITTTTTTSTTTTSTTALNKSPPKASSIVLTPTTLSRDEVQSSVTPDMLVASSSSSWKWAGAGIGFFLGLLVGCCIYITVKVVQPNKGRLVIPTVFWRVKEDNQELLHEEQCAAELPTIRKDQGYHTVPGSDVF